MFYYTVTILVLNSSSKEQRDESQVKGTVLECPLKLNPKSTTLSYSHVYVNTYIEARENIILWNIRELIIQRNPQSAGKAFMTLYVLLCQQPWVIGQPYKLSYRKGPRRRESKNANRRVLGTDEEKGRVVGYTFTAVASLQVKPQVAGV